MGLADLAQVSANSYRQLGDRHSWRKGRNSTRGYDGLTIPLDTWDDRPHQRYLALLDHHLSTAACHLDASGACAHARNTVASVTLARGAFVASAKAAWLLDETVVWAQRAARAHLELYANLDAIVRLLPKRIEAGHPNFRRRQWKEARDRFAVEVVTPLFGKRALAGKRGDIELCGQSLLTVARLEDRFAQRLSETSESQSHAVPSVLIDPAVDLLDQPGAPMLPNDRDAERSLVVATEAWLHSLGGWVRYNAWDTDVVAELEQRLARVR
jgi:hypothetical protein